MANIISLTKVDAQAVNTYRKDIALEDDINIKGLMYHLGTNLGQGSFSTPVGTDVIVSTTGSVLSGNTNDIFNDNANGTAVEISTGSLPFEIKFNLQNDYFIDLSGYSFTGAGFLSYQTPSAWIVEGSNDDISWTTLDNINETLPIPENTYSTFFLKVNQQDYFKYIRFIFTAGGNNGRVQINYMRLFGALRNLVTGTAGFKTPGDNFSNLLNVDIKNPNTNRIISYDESNQVWESRLNTPWRTSRQIMTGDLVLTSAYIPTFYTLSPNGANRNVDLPFPPQKNDTLRIRNLDGAFDITIRNENTLNDVAHYWTLDETSGTRVDSVGSIDLTDVNTVVSDTGIKGNLAARFNGSNEYLSNNTFTTPTGDFSISVWFKLDNTSGNQVIVSQWLNTDQAFFIRTVSNEVQARFISSSSTIEFNADNFGIIEAEVYYHVVAMYEVSTGQATLIVNDSTPDTAIGTPGETLNSSAYDLLLGAFNNGGITEYYDGNIDELGFWNRLLTPTEITALYNNGEGLLAKDILPTNVILNNSGKLDYELVYDGQGTWHLTG